MTDSACTVTVEQTETTINVAIGGEFDLAALDSVRAALRPWLTSPMVVDLDAITFMDSSGLLCLLQLQADASQRGGQLIVRMISPVVQRLLQLSGVGDRLLGTG